ncbi:MAG: flagellar hook protein FlgE [Pseudomonadota bacterium]
MSLFGAMKTSVSGMNAQSARLSTVGENIANSDTTGYKHSSVEFSSLVVSSEAGAYSSGAVGQHIRQSITQQGVLQFTSSSTDLAINGDGFFIVGDADDNAFLTRAGSFVADGTGELVNAAGYKLLAYPDGLLGSGAVVNGTAGLEVVNIAEFALETVPSTAGTLTLNLPADATIVAAGNLPSANAATAAPTGKSSIIAYDNLGREVTFDVYMTKTAADTWEVSAYDRADAASPTASFPYTAGPLVTTSVAFDPTTGSLTGASANSITIPVPNGSNLEMDLSEFTQFATDFQVSAINVNGNPASNVDRVDFAEDGTVYAVYGNGQRIPQFRIPVATVASPDQLLSETGNIFKLTPDAGEFRVGVAGSSGLGTIESGALESSTVDLAGELTTMIQAQRSYTANSKVFQTGSEMLDVLVNLKR